jgi:hypothetical protein
VRVVAGEFCAANVTWRSGAVHAVTPSAAETREAAIRGDGNPRVTRRRSRGGPFPLSAFLLLPFHVQFSGMTVAPFQGDTVEIRGSYSLVPLAAGAWETPAGACWLPHRDALGVLRQLVTVRSVDATDSYGRTIVEIANHLFGS